MRVFSTILTILVTLSLSVTAAPAEAVVVERALPGLPVPKLGQVEQMPASLLGKFAVAKSAAAAPASSGGAAPSADWGFAGNSAGWNWKREPEPAPEPKKVKKEHKKPHGHKTTHHKTKAPAHKQKAGTAPAGDWGFTSGGPGANWKRTDGQQAKMERVVKRVLA